jgi:hypothetical protein
MPTVLVINGYRFSFYSNESNELPHIHIGKSGASAKYWLVPDCSEVYSYGFTIREQRDIKDLVFENKELLIQKWNEYFGK